MHIAASVAQHSMNWVETLQIRKQSSYPRLSHSVPKIRADVVMKTDKPLKENGSSHPRFLSVTMIIDIFLYFSSTITAAFTFLITSRATRSEPSVFLQARKVSRSFAFLPGRRAGPIAVLGVFFCKANGTL